MASKIGDTVRLIGKAASYAPKTTFPWGHVVNKVGSVCIVYFYDYGVSVDETYVRTLISHRDNS